MGNHTESGDDVLGLTDCIFSSIIYEDSLPVPLPFAKQDSTTGDGCLADRQQAIFAHPNFPALSIGPKMKKYGST